MFTSLLDEGASSGNGGASTWIMLAIVAVLVVVIVVFYFLSNKKRKKQEQDAQDLINAVKPGNKVKTIGGICGIVVEVNNEENTFVLETGTETSGKSYMQFDRQAIYQTDAVVEKKAEKEEVKDEGQASAENVEATALSEPFEEVSAKPEEKPVKDAEVKAEELTTDANAENVKAESNEEAKTENSAAKSNKNSTKKV